MKKRKLGFNEKGMSLVEVLAALVILGIVFIGFISIFPNMTLFNASTEAKLETMNYAKVELDKITETRHTKESFKTLLKDKKDANGSADGEYKRIIKKSGENNKYKVEIDVYDKVPALNPESGDTGQTKLYTVHIKILKDEVDGRELSETFGFIEVGAE